jgi:molybdopterin/thiamine biosynthesis adenylyltransferase
VSTLSRYARQIVLPEVGVNGQQLLRDSSVLVVGAGGLGCPAALYLAGAGIGRLVIVDRDRVELSNLHRQILYVQDDVGRSKAEAAAARLQALNPEVVVEAVVASADDGLLRTQVGRVDLVLDCSDNFPTRFAVNAACVAARRPLVSAAAIRQEAQLAVFDSGRGGPCYACLFAEGGEGQERCEDTGVLGPVAGVAGTYQALLALRYLLGLGAGGTGGAGGATDLHVWDAAALAWRRLKITRDAHCKVCGENS